MKKTAIIIVVYNLDRLIKLQLDAYNRFCSDENYDIIIMDNSTDAKVSEAVKYHTELQGRIYVKLEGAPNDNSLSHAWACNMAYAKFANEYSYLFFSDHDLFPVKPFCVEDILKDIHIAGLEQDRDGLKYLWAGMVMVNNLKVEKSKVNFDPALVDGVGMDTGGHLHHIISTLPEEHYLFFNEIHRTNPYFSKGKYKFYAMNYNDKFMHFINGSNWNSDDDYEERLNSLINILTTYSDQNGPE